MYLHFVLLFVDVKFFVKVKVFAKVKFRVRVSILNHSSVQDSKKVWVVSRAFPEVWWTFKTFILNSITYLLVNNFLT